MNVKTNLANKNNYGSSRLLSQIKYIVIHYTGNDGDTDENNGKYFKRNIVKASAHYFVDDDSITQSVPDNYVAWSVGGNKYSNCSSTGGGKYHKKCTNTNSLSIEICDDVKNGVVYPSANTIQNALELTRLLMNKYKIPAANVIRHFDVTGKSCPAYWCGTSTKDAKWRSEFWNKLSVSDTVDNKAALKSLIEVAKEVISGKWGNGVARKTKLTKAGYDYAEVQAKVAELLNNKTNTFKHYTVKITASKLNVRGGAGVSYKITTTVKRNQVYTIVDEKDGWGKLKSGAGWISLKYTEKV